MGVDEALPELSEWTLHMVEFFTFSIVFLHSLIMYLPLLQKIFNLVFICPKRVVSRSQSAVRKEWETFKRR